MLNFFDDTLIKNIEKVSKWKEFHNLTFGWKQYRLIVIGICDNNSFIYKLNINNLIKHVLTFLHYHFMDQEPTSYDLPKVKAKKRRKKRGKKGKKKNKKQKNKNSK